MPAGLAFFSPEENTFSNRVSSFAGTKRGARLVCIPPARVPAYFSKETGDKWLTWRLNGCGTAQMMKKQFQIRFSGAGDEERMKEG